LSALLLFTAPGCAPKRQFSEDHSVLLDRKPDRGEARRRPAGEGPETGRVAPAPPPDLPSSPPRLKSGLMGMAGAQEDSGPEGAGTGQGEAVLNFNRAEISEVVREVFGEYLEANYVIDPGVQGQISLYFEGDFDRQELLRIVTYSLRASGIDVVREDGVYVIRPLQRSNTDLDVADSLLLKQDEKGVEPMIVIYRPRYIPAAKSVELLSNFLTPGRLATTEPMTGSVIFVENRDNARKVLGLLKALDMNVLDEVGLEIVTLQALSPEEAQRAMENITKRLDVFENSKLGENLAFLPLKQFNGLLIMAQNPEVLDAAKKWLEALDVQGREAGEQIFVYQVENGLAENITDILSQVFSSAENAGKPSPGSEESEKTQHVVQAEGEGAEAPPPAASVSGALSTDLAGDVLIIPDTTNNVIVVRAMAADLEKVKKAIQALDIMPRAVLIEVIIAEVRLNDDLSYGVEWFLRNQQGVGGEDYEYGVGSTTNSRFDPDFETNVPNGLAFFIGSADFRNFFQALRTNTDVDILSAPTLLAMDNTKASITVGGREPIVTRSSQGTTEEDDIVSEIQYEETGIILDVTPHINSSGLVRLEVKQQITDASEELVSLGGVTTPRFTERIVETSLVAEDGKTAVIGGIMRTEKTKTRQKVPVVGDIPLLGFFFSSTTDSTEKTELIVAITPRVVDSERDAVIDEFIGKLNRIKDRIESEQSLIERIFQENGKQKSE
jgi:general secretion pathway protein D